MYYECVGLLLTSLMMNKILVKSMTLREISELRTYLEEKSVIHKHSDTDKARRDRLIEDEENAWEQSGMFEGDMILNLHQRQGILADVSGSHRNGDPVLAHRWPNNELVYYINPHHFDDDQVQVIKDAFKVISGNSCITFRPNTSDDQNVMIIDGDEPRCSSLVGLQGGQQTLHLAAGYRPGRGCFRVGTIVHELLHALGFFHQHSHILRDNYIQIIWQNIKKDDKHNFRKFRTVDYGVPYDYGSIMHYRTNSYSNNGRDTIIPTTRENVTIGQRIGLSEGDIKKLNSMYCQNIRKK